MPAQWSTWTGAGTGVGGGTGVAVGGTGVAGMFAATVIRFAFSTFTRAEKIQPRLAADAAELIPGVFHISAADIELRPSGDGADDAERGARSRAHVDVNRGQVRLDRKAGRGWHGRIGGRRRIGSLRSLWLHSRRRGLLSSAAARLLRGRRRPPAST